MASDLTEKAREAFVDDDFQLAVDLYSQAITLNPENAGLFADRAQANLKLNNFTEAVGDANRAIELDRSMAKAYLRKGIACLKLEEYHTAKAALEVGASLSSNDSRFTRLLKECDNCIEEENKLLNKPLTSNGLASTTPVSVETLADFKKQCNLSTQIDTSLKPKYRHEFYQKPDEVVVTLFAKGIPARHVTIEFGEQILSIKIEIPGEDAYHFQPRLFGKISLDKCRYQILSTKIEIRLVKADAIQWASLEYSREAIVPLRVNVSSGGSVKPAYPSSKPKSRDWDKLEAQVKKEVFQQLEFYIRDFSFYLVASLLSISTIILGTDCMMADFQENEEKLNGDAALNKLFQDIYQDADEDIRRAMTKSFVESNGTVLSTDWKEVSSMKVASSPPKGMELRKW